MRNYLILITICVEDHERKNNYKWPYLVLKFNYLFVIKFVISTGTSYQ